MYAFNLDKFVPEIPIPLREHETGAMIKLNEIVHRIYETVRYDLRIDYTKPPDPPLEGEWVEWAKRIMESAQEKE